MGRRIVKITHVFTAISSKKTLYNLVFVLWFMSRAARRNPRANMSKAKRFRLTARAPKVVDCDGQGTEWAPSVSSHKIFIISKS